MSRTKPKSKRKSELVQIRMSATEKRKLVRAAEDDGLSLSAWLRRLALKAAEKKR